MLKKIINLINTFLIVFVILSSPSMSKEIWTLNDTMNTKLIKEVKISPDGKNIIFSVLKLFLDNKDGKANEEVYITDSKGNNCYKFLSGDYMYLNLEWSPGGDFIAFLSDRSSKAGIWLIRKDAGEAYEIFDSECSISSIKWSPSGKYIGFIMQDAPTDEEKKKIEEKDDAYILDGNLKMNHIWIVSTKKNNDGRYTCKRITKGDFNVSSFDWAPDEKSIVFSHQISPLERDSYNSDISKIKVATGEIVLLAGSQENEIQPLYSPDGKYIAYCRSDLPLCDFSAYRVCIIHTEVGKTRELVKTPNEYPVNLIKWSSDSKNIYLSELNRTYNGLYSIDINTNLLKQINPENIFFTGVSIDTSCSVVAMAVESPDNPHEVFIAGVRDFKPVKITTINEGLPIKYISKTEVIKWTSSDGKEIEGLLTYPLNYKKGQKYPLLVYIHGGPALCFSQSFIGSPGFYPVATFASEGYAVLRPNIRGSTGYGGDFRKANIKDWGGKDYNDIMTGVDHLIDKGIADRDRLGIMGWSYGGYMTAWVITQTNRFKAASVGAGISDIISMMSCDLPGLITGYFREPFWENNSSIYLERSAVMHVKNIDTPVIIQHGECDNRVPYGQGIELYTALRMLKKNVVFVSYPRTGHIPSEPKLCFDCMKRNLDWFNKYIPVSEN